MRDGFETKGDSDGDRVWKGIFYLGALPFVLFFLTRGLLAWDDANGQRI